MKLITHRSAIIILTVITLAALLVFGSQANAQTTLRWGGDSEGGAPFVEADPGDPSKVSGFDVEVAEEIAKGLGRKPEFVHVAFASIDQSVQRGDFDIGMSGVEDTPARRAALAATIPYYQFTETLTVREANKDKFTSLDELRGRRIGTLGGTIAYDILLAAEKTHGITAVSYDDDVHPYEDIVSGRLDAVLLDNIIAQRAMRRTPGLFTHFDKPLATGHYIVVLAKENTQLRDQVNAILKARMQDGTLERIYKKWEIWDEFQPKLFAAVNVEQTLLSVPASAEAAETKQREQTGVSVLQATRSYLPALLKAALITIVLSCAAMALAVIVGILVATGRVYGNALLRGILTT